ncbi:MAG: hypothetical protein NTV65_11050, partial [Proteobacteria bacterium]|nr:hypothetical protein [Pseudomonadota bacterium]
TAFAISSLSFVCASLYSAIVSFCVVGSGIAFSSLNKLSAKCLAYFTGFLANKCGYIRWKTP